MQRRVKWNLRRGKKKQKMSKLGKMEDKRKKREAEMEEEVERRVRNRGVDGYDQIGGGRASGINSGGLKRKAED